LSKTIFRISTLSLCLSLTLSAHFSATNICTLSDLSLTPIQNSLHLLPLTPKNLQPLPLHRVSCMHATSASLLINAFINSPALPVSESTFLVLTPNPQPFRGLLALRSSELCCVLAGFLHLLGRQWVTPNNRSFAHHLLGFLVQAEDNKGRCTKNPDGCHSIQTNWCLHLHHPQHFYAGCPSCHNRVILVYGLSNSRNYNELECP